MRGIVWHALNLLPFAVTCVCVFVLMQQSPFTAPMVDRSLEQTRATLTRAMARTVDTAWLLPRVQDAIFDQDLMQLSLLLGIANDHGIVLPRPMIEDIAALEQAAGGMLANATSCGACAVDMTACQTLVQVTACALPFELTPAGDLNALRRAGVQYVADGEVDRLDVGLAVIGLGATGAVLASGGTSYSIKAGTSVLRMARRMGTMTTALSARLSALVGDAVKWDRFDDLVALRIGPADMIDAAKLDELGVIGGSLRRVSGNTSLAETIDLLRHVDTAQDAARLARASDAMGPRTRGAFEVLGKSRVLRATVRLSDLAIGAAAALYALGLQIALFCAQQIGNACWRTLHRIGGRGRRGGASAIKQPLR